jgi:hypothetical protein
MRPPTTAALSACEKAETMWRTRILPSRYEQLPPLTGVGFTDLLAITHRAFARKAFTTEGDELEAGRAKRIHAFGAEARLRLVVSPHGASGRYSGFFQSGAECAIGRFSLANKPTAHTSIPALAIKFFVDGNHPSLNLHLDELGRRPGRPRLLRQRISATSCRPPGPLPRRSSTVRSVPSPRISVPRTPTRDG